MTIRADCSPKVPYQPDMPIVPLVDSLHTDPTPSTVVLSRSARVLWRSPDAVQLELGRRAVVLDGVDSGVIGALIAGSPADGLDAVRGALRAGGFTEDMPADDPVPPPAHLAGE